MKIWWKYQPKLPYKGWALAVQVEDHDHVITVRTFFSNATAHVPPSYRWVEPIAQQLAATARAALAIAADS